MASIRFEPPSPFNFKVPDEWTRWKRRFEQFRLASGLSTESHDRQISTLLYSMGDAAEDALVSTKITVDERKDYGKVLEKLDSFFDVRKNVIFERARFNQRHQRENESVEEFITSLFSLAEHCDYKDATEEMIRDRIVVGIRDKALSEKLQLGSETNPRDSNARCSPEGSRSQSTGNP